MSYPGSIPPPPGVVADPDHPQDVLNTINYVTQALTLASVTFFFVLRLYAKWRLQRGNWTVDDYATVAAYILMLGYCITGIFASTHGGGLNQWDVRMDDLQFFLKCGYAATIFYAPMTMCVKIALLVLTARIFGSVHRKTLIGVYTLLGVIVGYYVSGLIVKICICLPIPAYWRGETDKCLNQSAIITTDAIVSVVSDLAILLIPVPLTWSLHLSSKKKVRIMGVLCAGGTATAFSIYRLGMIVNEGKSANQTIVFTKVILTGDAEVGIGLICACLPSVTALFLRNRGTTDGSYGYARTGNSQAGNTILVNRTFHMTAEERRNQKNNGMSDGFEAIQDQAELMSYAQANPQTKDHADRRSLSL